MVNLIVLPDTSDDEALIIAKKIKKIFSENSFNTANSSIKMTLSMGISDCFETGTYKLDTLMSLADKCLYLSKENGRDKITVYKSEDKRPTYER